MPQKKSEDEKIIFLLARIAVFDINIDTPQEQETPKNFFKNFHLIIVPTLKDTTL